MNILVAVLLVPYEVINKLRLSECGCVFEMISPFCYRNRGLKVVFFSSVVNRPTRPTEPLGRSVGFLFGLVWQSGLV